MDNDGQGVPTSLEIIVLESSDQLGPVPQVLQSLLHLHLQPEQQVIEGQSVLLYQVVSIDRMTDI